MTALAQPAPKGRVEMPVETRAGVKGRVEAATVSTVSARPLRTTKGDPHPKPDAHVSNLVTSPGSRLSGDGERSGAIADPADERVRDLLAE